GVLGAAAGDVAPERTGADVDVGHRCADVDQGQHLPLVDAVVHLVAVLQGEGVDVDQHRDLAGLADHRGVVVDLLLLHGDEDDVDVLAGAGGGEGDVVEVDVVDVEGDVLLGFPLDGLGQLLRRHGRKGDLFDDHGVAGKGGGVIGILDGFFRVQPPDRLHHQR